MTQKVYVVGLGPGGIEQMTQRAKAALESCDVIAGYHVYIDLIKNDFTGIHTYNCLGNVEVIDIKIGANFNIFNIIGAVWKRLFRR